MTQIASVIDQWADNTPEKIALVCAEQSYSYQQLYHDANNVAVNLQMKHYASEHIALHMPECYEYVLCYLALHKIAAVPLSITYKAKAQEIEFKLIHGEAKALVIHHSKLQELAKINLEQTQVQDIWVVGDGEHRYISFQKLLSQQKKLQQEDVDENTLAAIYYTSGSTGNPKAVMHSHKTLYQGLLNGAELLESHHNSVLVMKQPLGHMGAYLQTFSNLLHGATTILTNDFDEYALAIKQHHPTMLVCLPTLLNEVMHCEILDEGCFENLELVTSGGDKVPLALQQLVKQRTGLPVKEHYGSSEAWIVTKNIEGRQDKTGSMGQLLTGFDIRLLDENKSPVKVGEMGEIWVSSTTLFIGYFKNPEETNKVLQDGWFGTGDLASLDDDGFYWFRGRAKQVIVRAGRKMTPQEIEEIIYQHPGVKASCVVAKKDEVQGEIPIAFVELKKNQVLDEEDLLIFIEQRLADYRVPEKIIFLDEMPRNSVGKIDRTGLQNSLAT